MNSTDQSSKDKESEQKFDQEDASSGSIETLLAGKKRRPWQIATTAGLLPVLSSDGKFDAQISDETSPSLLPARMDLFFKKPDGPKYTDPIRSQSRRYNIFEFKSLNESLDFDGFLQMREYSTKYLRNLRTGNEKANASEIAGFFTTFRKPLAFVKWLKASGYSIKKVGSGVYAASKKPFSYEPRLVIISLREVDPEVYPTIRVIAPGLTPGIACN